ncbi:beta-glucosidase [Spinactinospora alkalitolerans]|uniref:Exo-alpha-(1->6)-L-arabinopyranosidase n=1 Tax=Spinactinospora alkalitolerans TaxID=687207 RepID=A0A852TYA2_9ACTN|nr:glycoside hydrolase family 3 protein [Spinactinospora alkalitolerans]NYE46984.1 beta-glucosidase [Spinactinospora alkalitolerans]
MKPRSPHPTGARRFLRRLTALALAACLLAAPANPAAAQETLPFRDPGLPLEERVADLLGRLTLDEKVSLLHQYQPAVPRLGIEPFRTGSEALHGVSWLGPATVFPQSVGLGSTWDPELVERVGDAVGTEMRGYHAQDPAANGLNVWAPVVDPLRDPRWGRNEEGYSEDPALIGAMSTAYAGGLRGDDPFYLKTAPTLKHFMGYNVEADRDRLSISVPPRVMHEYVHRAFRPAIAAGNATGVMASYNLVNGRPAHLAPEINDAVRTWTDEELMVVSDAFGPSNVVNTQEYYQSHPESHAAMLRAGIDSFTDQGTESEFTIEQIEAALDQGLVSEADVDTAVGRILSVRFRLGEFDPPELNPYADITADAIDSPEHRELAREAAREQMVLLKNADGALPLDPGKDREVAVVGPLADTLYEDWYSGTMPYEVTPADGIARRLGEQGSVVSSEGADRIALKTADGRYVTAASDADGGPLRADGDGAEDARAISVFDWGEGVVTLRTEANGKVVGLGEGNLLYNDQEQPNGWSVQQLFRFEERSEGRYVIKYAGYDTWNRKYVVVGDDGTLSVSAETAEEATEFTRETLADGTEEAVEAAAAADTAVVVVGNMPFINGRETDDREDIALPSAQQELVKAVTEANPDTVLVVESSYPQAITWAQDHVPAVLWTSHAGQETGNALADVLFGDHNPGGRLPQTWYRSVEGLPDMLNYDIIDSGHTYQYFTGDPLYAFGHGLSYTGFEYGRPELDDRRIDADGEVTVRVPVTNTGDRAGDEVVQLYTRQKRSRVEQPLKTLRDFERIHLDAGETATVELRVRAADLAFWDVTRGRSVVEDAAHEVLIGSSSDDIRRKAGIRVHGEDIPARDLSKETRAVDFDDYSGVRIVDETKVSGDAVGTGEEGGWISFAESDLRSRPDTLTARVARASGGEAAIEVRLGSPTGRRIGRVEVPDTGGAYAWETVSVELDGAAGIRDVHLVLTGELRVSSFSLT